jgi:RNA polymerase sigma-70 factor (ECF subfamily)
MERVAAGDAAAFSVLFARHEAPVYRFLLRRTDSAEAAGDLYQETFLRIYRARAAYRRGAPFRPWLYGIALNAARDAARKQRRSPLTVVPDELPGGPAPRPDAHIDLRGLLTQMPEGLRDAFLLGAVEGLDHNEVAEILAISPANARARISRGRVWLREALGGDHAL